MADVIHTIARVQQGLGFDYTAGTVNFVFADDAGLWTPDPEDSYVADITSAGGVLHGTRTAVTSPSVTQDGTNHRAIWGANDYNHAGVALSDVFQWLIAYNLVTSDADSWLIASFDIGAQTGDGNPISVDFNADRLLSW
jgi:hypothetical protein